MISIKRPILLNILVWNFPKKSLLNDLVYLKFISVHENQGNLVFLKKSMLNDQYYLNFKF